MLVKISTIGTIFIVEGLCKFQKNHAYAHNIWALATMLGCPCRLTVGTGRWLLRCLMALVVTPWSMAVT